MNRLEKFLDKALHIIEKYIAPMVLLIMIIVGGYYIFDTVKYIYEYMKR